MFCGSRVELFYAIFFLSPDSAERVYYQGLAKFLLPNGLVLWLQNRSCFTANFCYPTLSSVYWNQGLNFTKFFTPWSCLPCVLSLQSRSCFTTNFCYLTLSTVCWNQGLNCAEFFTALVLFTMCFVAPEQTQVDLRPIFCYLTVSSVYWNQGLNFYKLYYALGPVSRRFR